MEGIVVRKVDLRTVFALGHLIHDVRLEDIVTIADVSINDRELGIRALREAGVLSDQSVLVGCR